MEGLIAMVVILGLVWFWADSMRARELALSVCRRACGERDVQLLEQTVALSGMALARDPAGRIGLRRYYAFEFSTDGTDRRQASITLRGLSVELVRMEHPDGAVILECGHHHIPRDR